MNLNTYGPLLAWLATFVIGAAIKLVAFDSDTLLFEAGADASLWAAGVLFSLAVAEGTYSGARLTRTVQKKPSGAGLEVDYGVTVDDNAGFTPRMMYLFLGALVVWILVLLLSGVAQQAYAANGKQYGIKTVFCACAGLALAAISVVVAVRALMETTR